MSLDVMKEKGVPLDRQVFTWRELAGAPFSKLDDDAFTRVRVILMNGIESEALRFGHAAARMHDAGLRVSLAQTRRLEQHQQTVINWLLPADQSPLETTIGYEQVAVEVTAALAQQETDPYVAAVLRFGLLEDFDHLYRYSALMDRLFGMDANTLLQSYTDIRPGRPTEVEHRAPADDLRRAFDRRQVDPITRLNVLTIVAGEHQTHDYYMNVGPTFADPVARQLYAEIASIEEQHVTQYESLADPGQSVLEQWLMHELCEVYTYWSCRESESNSRVRQIWDRFLDYELGHFHMVADLFRRTEKRDPAELVPRSLPDAIGFAPHRDFVRVVLEDEVELRAKGPELIPAKQEGKESERYRGQLNRSGSPSAMVAMGYRWMPGTELVERARMLEEEEAL